MSNSVDAMSPGRMIVALYDRLLLDLERARQAIDEHDHPTAHECLIHAQSIVAELYDSLDRERWPAGNGLADLYVFVLGELVSANLEKSSARVVSCHALLSPLRDAWQQAAGIVPSVSTGGAP